MIRMAINSLAQNLIKLSPSTSKSAGDLDDIIGIVNVKGKGTSDSSERIDNIYYNKSTSF